MTVPMTFGSLWPEFGTLNARCFSVYYVSHKPASINPNQSRSQCSHVGFLLVYVKLARLV